MKHELELQKGLSPDHLSQQEQSLFQKLPWGGDLLNNMERQGLGDRFGRINNDLQSGESTLLIYNGYNGAGKTGTRKAGREVITMQLQDYQKRTGIYVPIYESTYQTAYYGAQLLEIIEPFGYDEFGNPIPGPKLPSPEEYDRITALQGEGIEYGLSLPGQKVVEVEPAGATSLYIPRNVGGYEERWVQERIGRTNRGISAVYHAVALSKSLESDPKRRVKRHVISVRKHPTMTQDVLKYRTSMMGVTGENVIQRLNDAHIIPHLKYHPSDRRHRYKSIENFTKADRDRLAKTCRLTIAPPENQRQSDLEAARNEQQLYRRGLIPEPTQKAFFDLFGETLGLGEDEYTSVENTPLVGPFHYFYDSDFGDTDLLVMKYPALRMLPDVTYFPNPLAA